MELESEMDLSVACDSKFIIYLNCIYFGFEIIGFTFFNNRFTLQFAKLF